MLQCGLCRSKEKCLKPGLKCVNRWSISTVKRKRVPESWSSNRETTSSSIDFDTEVQQTWKITANHAKITVFVNFVNSCPRSVALERTKLLLLPANHNRSQGVALCSMMVSEMTNCWSERGVAEASRLVLTTFVVRDSVAAVLAGSKITSICHEPHHKSFVVAPDLRRV